MVSITPIFCRESDNECTQLRGICDYGCMQLSWMDSSTIYRALYGGLTVFQLRDVYLKEYELHLEWRRRAKHYQVTGSTEALRDSTLAKGRGRHRKKNLVEMQWCGF